MNTILLLFMENYNEFKVAINSSFSIFLFLFATVIIHYLYTRWSDIRISLKTMLIGSALETTGWGLHRLYWANEYIQKMYPNWNNPIGPDDKYFWVGDLPIYLSIMGIVLIIAPLLNYVDVIRPKDYATVISIFIFITAILFGILIKL